MIPNKYLMVAGLGAGAYIVYKVSQAGKAVKEVVTEDLNPASDKNVVYRNTPEPVKNKMQDALRWLDCKGLLFGGIGDKACINEAVHSESVGGVVDTDNIDFNYDIEPLRYDDDLGEM